MRFTQFFAAAALAAPLVLAAPTSSIIANTATIDLTSDLTANPHYATALWQVKEKYPGISDEDARTAALGYLEAIGVQTTGAPPNGTDSLAERGIEKRCCSGCDQGNCIIAIFLLGFCCIGS
ncbi:hypothetical protein THAR02_03438 [Trichoderma harzianum]|uniref:Uncharacterized protein n=1 Tax=Trichoderma harzianum TaxID=5544 RepID=A0A0F9XHE1_TRIHA|nr:hypothetical protein THAR02_03438 [Trichoderma harzianum]